MSSTTPSIPTRGHAEREADGAGALDHVGLADQLLGERVGDVVDAGPLDAARRCGPCRRRTSAMEAYQSRWSSATLSTAAACGAHRVGVVQLEAGQLDREHVVGHRVHDRLDERQPDVAGRHAAQPRRAQDRVEHLDRRGLAVGAGDGEPGRVVVGVAKPPGQLDLAPDRYAAVAGLREQRRVGRQPGEVTSRSTSSGSVAVTPAPSRTVAPSTSSSSAFAARPSGPSGYSSSAVTAAPRWGRLSAAAKPETPNPATTARTPSQESCRPSAGLRDGHPMPETHSA